MCSYLGFGETMIGMRSQGVETSSSKPIQGE